MIDESTTSTALNFQGDQYCQYRLPCGICAKTNSICPLSWSVPTITCTAINGSSD